MAYTATVTKINLVALPSCNVRTVTSSRYIPTTTSSLRSSSQAGAHTKFIPPKTRAATRIVLLAENKSAQQPRTCPLARTWAPTIAALACCREGWRHHRPGCGRQVSPLLFPVWAPFLRPLAGDPRLSAAPRASGRRRSRRRGGTTGSVHGDRRNRGQGRQ